MDNKWYGGLRKLIEITFDDIEDIDYEREGDHAQFDLFEWLNDELELQPKELHNAVLNGECRLSLNFNPGGLE